MEEKRNIWAEVVKALKERNLTIATMESCTGGGIANEITCISGASDVLHESYVTYCNEAKIKLGVPAEVIEKYTVYSRETAMAMANAVAKLANADYFIQHLENGYDTVLTNGGASLSQGQRQLIAIARAAVANPPVMILDEATSSIDSRTEAMVQQGMDQIMKGRTVFVIAHRLSTIKNSDVIMVLEDGRIIERGNHEQLLLQKGKYYQLYTGNAITQQE